MTPYNPQDWYWLADDGRVFASARQVTVDETDTGYRARIDGGGFATTWPRDRAGLQTDAALQWVFDNAEVRVYASHALRQAALCDAIDAQAQAIRDRYMTPGGAQAATYMFKQAQAVQASIAQATTDAGKTPDQLAALYPDLANEIGITVDPGSGQPATELYGVMRAVLATLAVWLPLNRTIEATRLRAKKAINAATTAADAQAAFDAVTWPAA